MRWSGRPLKAGGRRPVETLENECTVKATPATGLGRFPLKICIYLSQEWGAEGGGILKYRLPSSDPNALPKAFTIPTVGGFSHAGVSAFSSLECCNAVGSIINQS